MKKIKKILLIDDDKVNNYINEALLKDLNIAEVITVRINGEEAMEHLIENCQLGGDGGSCPELVILDHHMPIMDGLEMMKELKKRNFINNQRIVFILLGVYSMEEDIEEFRKLGVQEYTSKPLSEQTVMDVYRKYFADGMARDHIS
jgi:two-component system response regulator YesN